jgi:hypothetical protein
MADKPSKYKPAPKSFDANTVRILIGAVQNDWSRRIAYEKVSTVVGTVACQLMEEAVGLFPKPWKEDRWSHPSMSEEMSKDPYITHQHTYVDKSLSSDRQRLEYLREWAIDMRDAGAWTLHSETGGQLGVFGSSHNIRVNPDAMMSVARQLAIRNKPYEDMPAVAELPGWRYLTVKSEDSWTSMVAFLDWQAGQLVLGVHDNRLVFHNKKEKFRPHQVFMEGVLQSHSLEVREKEDIQFFNQLFKDVPAEIVNRKLYDRDDLKKFQSSLEAAQREYEKARDAYKELRAAQRQLNSVGTVEDVLDIMGKNLEEALLVDAMAWLNMDAEDRWRELHIKFCRSLAKEFLEGRLNLPSEKPKEAANA